MAYRTNEQQTVVGSCVCQRYFAVLGGIYFFNRNVFPPSHDYKCKKLGTTIIINETWDNNNSKYVCFISFYFVSK